MVGYASANGLCMTYKGDRVYQSFGNPITSGTFARPSIAMTYPFGTSWPHALTDVVNNIPMMFCSSTASIVKFYSNLNPYIIKTSSDYGVTWTLESTLSMDFSSMSCDSLCNIYFMISTDTRLLYSRTSNVASLSQNTLITETCGSCAVSSDGQIVAVTGASQVVYISTNAGNSFSSFSIAGNTFMAGNTSIAISDGYIYILTSTNLWKGSSTGGFSVIYTYSGSAVNNTSLACSGSGQYILAGLYEGNIIYSNNYGASFKTYGTVLKYWSAAISKDGSKGFVSSISNELNLQFYYNNFLSM